MKDWAAIRRAYVVTNASFELLLDEAADSDRSEDIAEVEALALLNECAYFLLIWGQFETFVDAEVTDLQGESGNLPFMQRFVLLDPGYRDHDFVARHYALRCSLAHGRTQDVSSLSLPLVADALESIVDAIESGGPDHGASI